MKGFREWFSHPDRGVWWVRLDGSLAFLGLLVLIRLSIAALIYFPEWQVKREVPGAAGEQAFSLQNEARRMLTQIILGIFGLLFTWRRVRAADKTVQAAEQGHLTGRFTKAVEQLGRMENGEPNIEVRLGAIYALERIAIDSPRDQSAIVEILCAYVRRNAVEPEAERPGIDIQAILTVPGLPGPQPHKLNP